MSSTASISPSASATGWPAFNVADSAITVGVALMLWHQFRFGKDTETGTQ